MRGKGTRRRKDGKGMKGKLGNVKKREGKEERILMKLRRENGKKRKERMGRGKD